MQVTVVVRPRNQKNIFSFHMFSDLSFEVAFLCPRLLPRLNCSSTLLHGLWSTDLEPRVVDLGSRTEDGDAWLAATAENIIWASKERSKPAFKTE